MIRMRRVKPIGSSVEVFSSRLTRYSGKDDRSAEGWQSVTVSP